MTPFGLTSLYSWDFIIWPGSRLMWRYPAARINSGAGLAVLVYIVVRIFSKMSGVYAATRWFNMDQGTCQYLPRCLLSQAGTTIGLTMLVAQQLPEVSDQILTVMLSAVIFLRSSLRH